MVLKKGSCFWVYKNNLFIVHHLPAQLKIEEGAVIVTKVFSIGTLGTQKVRQCFYSGGSNFIQNSTYVTM
jgi:hypothetical protein